MKKSFFSMVLGLGVAVAAPAFGEMYQWRTEDGGYAFTDDRDQIPARYRPAATAVRSRDLDRYERFTPQDDAASADYAAKLTQRLERLRAINAAPLHTVVPVAAVSRAAAPTQTLSIATGNRHAPEIQVAAGGAQGPIVVEPVNAKQSGDFRTRRVTVVQQGGQTLAVIKGNPHHFNPTNDIYDEDALVQGAPLD